MAYKIKFTGQFKKELKLAKKQGKDINKLFKIVDILAEKKVLDIKYKDHALIIITKDSENAILNLFGY